MRKGDSVNIKIDTYPDRTLRGKVESIMAGTGAAFSLFPPENATGNYVKVVQRVPVKILFDGPLPEGISLRVGMSVVPTVLVSR
jgi:membrane fusion protein (multidrug efflux system)